MKTKNKKPETEKHSQKSSLTPLSEAYREIAPYLNISSFFLAAIILFAWIGYSLDKLWDSKPWGLVIGAIVGIVVGFYNFFRTVSRNPDRTKKKK
jgi:F0F1-type ATP synthase assembly protein I